MRSIRTKITVMMLAAILICISSFGAIGIYAVTAESNRMSARNLNLICEDRKGSLNESLYSIEQSVNMIARYAIDTLDGMKLTEGGVLGASGSGVQEVAGRTEAQRQELDSYFDKHLEMIELAFKSVANHTNGVSTCYYRINPELTTTAKGFYYAKKDRIEFEKLGLTEIEAYDPDDLEHVGWYYIPLKNGRPTWIRPYNTANPGGLVMSFAVPMFKAGTFIGVIGMDMEFDTLVKQIQQFTDFKTGYFVLADEEGRLYYHPDFKMEKDPMDAFPEVMSVINDMSAEFSGQDPIHYSKSGEEWQMAYTTLANDLKLAAVVKEAEINEAMYRLTNIFVSTGIVIILVFVIFTTISMRRITDPLKKLTVAAGRITAGDYDVELDYENNDEVGELTRSFCSMRDRLKTTFAELSDNKEKLQQALIVSQQASRAKTTFLNNMSHEIRTPLNAIIGFAYLAEQDIDDKEQVYDCIQKISTSGKHLFSLINEVLDVSRIESGRMVLHDEEFSLRELLNQVNTLIESQCAHKHQTYTPRVIGNLSDTLSGDAMKLKEVLINILSNAVKYTPSGGKISFSAEQVAAFQDMCTIRFIIKDNGIGISEEFLPKIFDAFSQEDSEKADQYGSTGLGMAITKSIVQLMNGEIGVESKKGEGSTFTVTVTLKDVHKGEISDNAAKPSAENEKKADDAAEKKSGLEGVRVLIAEDVQINAELLKRILSKKGVEYEWAENGRIAVDMFSESPEYYFDAILMDIRMPVMDGLQASRSIRALERRDAKTVQIVAMTANAFAEDIQLSMQACMNVHLSKPVDVDKLYAVLENIRARKDTRRI